jgi:hypothetical protein
VGHSSPPSLATTGSGTSSSTYHVCFKGRPSAAEEPHARARTPVACGSMQASVRRHWCAARPATQRALLVGIMLAKCIDMLKRRRGHSVWDTRVNVADLRSSNWCAPARSSSDSSSGNPACAHCTAVRRPNLGAKAPTHRRWAGAAVLGLPRTLLRALGALPAIALQTRWRQGSVCGSGPRCWYTDTPHAAQHPRHAGGEKLDRKTKCMALFISAAR